MINEFWEPIPEFEGYSISSEGRIWSNKTNRFMRLFPDVRGYMYVCLRRQGRSIRRPVHQLVLEAHAGPRPVGFQVVRHLNGCSSDNRVENLCYGTFRQNNLDMVKHGRHRRTGSPKLSKDQVREILVLLEDGDLRQLEIAILYGVSDSTISRISRGVTWSSLSSPILDIEQRKERHAQAF